MESKPTPAQAAAALSTAQASRAALAEGIAVPTWLGTSVGAAIAVHIAAAAVGLGTGEPWLLPAGLSVFAAVAGLHLARFRRQNGVWLGGFASRVVLGTETAAAVSYVLALGWAMWAATDGRWWLVGLCSVAGGLGYALSGRRWMGAYRAEPSSRAGGEPAAWLALVAVAAVAGLVLLLAGGDAGP